MSAFTDTDSTVRVLIADDSAFMRTALSRMIASEAGLEVAATARSGSDALQKIASTDPDVVTLDLEMPGLNGLETLREIMKRFPRPVIVVSAAIEKDSEIAFDALSAGAFDYIPKQIAATSLEITHIRSELIAKIRSAGSHRRTDPDSQNKKPVLSDSNMTGQRAPVPPEIVAIGASTGGPRALQDLLPRLPGNLPVPLVIVQHMPIGFTSMFAARLNRLCSISVREARDQEPLQRGVAYIAPAGRHMLIKQAPDSQSLISLESSPVDTPYVPSVDVLMKSVAAVYGSRAAGVIMTGMGSDGAEGVKAIYDSGGLTIGQDKASCVVYGMPRVCARLGILTSVLPVSQIAAELVHATAQRRRA
jgi:two-component system, chemotaxis family, protein-glutamate methylesterase/glutaminase